MLGHFSSEILHLHGRQLCKELLNQRAMYTYEQQAISALYNKAVEKSGQKCIVSEKDNLHLPSGVKACLNQKAPGFRVLKLCAIGSWAGLERKRGYGLYLMACTWTMTLSFTLLETEDLSLAQ